METLVLENGACGLMVWKWQCNDRMHFGQFVAMAAAPPKMLLKAVERAKRRVRRG